MGLWTNGQESLGNEVIRYTTGNVYLNARAIRVCAAKNSHDRSLRFQVTNCDVNISSDGRMMFIPSTWGFCDMMGQDPVVSSGGRLTNFTEVMMRAWAGKSYEDKWDAYLRYFNWCRVQLSEFGKKRPYPNGAKPVWTRSGDIHWEISKEGRQAYQEFNWWIGSYNTFTEEYENSLWMKEIGKFPGDCESMSTDQANAIREKIEKFLERKIRTKEEGEADWAAGRRREFPSYVATPEERVAEKMARMARRHTCRVRNHVK